MNKEKNNDTLLKIENPGITETEKLFAALENSGMRRANCEKPGCGRMFLTRSERKTPDLCPPCEGLP